MNRSHYRLCEKIAAGDQLVQIDKKTEEAFQEDLGVHFVVFKCDLLCHCGWNNEDAGIDGFRLAVGRLLRRNVEFVAFCGLF